VDADVLYVAEERIYTSAGSAAGMDLMLHIVREDFGAEAASRVARRLVMPPHRSGGQAQFIERPVPADRHHRMVAVLEQVRAELDAPWTVERMADAAAMSVRTFLRRFTESTGQSPGQWLIAERIAEAQRLLESSHLSVERIAALVGFGSDAGPAAPLPGQAGRAAVGVPPHVQAPSLTGQGPARRAVHRSAPPASGGCRWWEWVSALAAERASAGFTSPVRPGAG
jgi:transcriptional regulator GlxA family with amidase domain